MDLPFVIAPTDAVSGFLDLRALLEIGKDGRPPVMMIPLPGLLEAGTKYLALFRSEDDGATVARVRTEVGLAKIEIDQNAAALGYAAGNLVLVPTEWMVMLSRVTGKIAIGFTNATDVEVGQTPGLTIVAQTKKL